MTTHQKRPMINVFMFSILSHFEIKNNGFAIYIQTTTASTIYFWFLVGMIKKNKNSNIEIFWTSGYKNIIL